MSFGHSGKSSFVAQSSQPPHHDFESFSSENRLTYYSISYHNCVILLFRPYIKVKFIGDNATSRERCVESANAISSLLGSFQRTFSLKKIGLFNCHAILTAAIVHLYVICHPNRDKYDEAQNSELCLVEAIRAMSEMRQGKRAHLDYLLSLCS